MKKFNPTISLLLLFFTLSFLLITSCEKNISKETGIPIEHSDSLKVPQCLPPPSMAKVTIAIRNPQTGIYELQKDFAFSAYFHISYPMSDPADLWLNEESYHISYREKSRKGIPQYYLDAQGRDLAIGENLYLKLELEANVDASELYLLSVKTPYVLAVFSCQTGIDNCGPCKLLFEENRDLKGCGCASNRKETCGSIMRYYNIVEN